jgi:hypothetical protein
VGYRLCQFIDLGILVSIYILYGEAFEKNSILLTKARYFSRVGSLVMHSFSICPATILESV